MEERRFITVF